ALLQVRTRARGLERHQRLPLRGGPARRDDLLGHPVGRQLVLREVDPPEVPVLSHVADDVDQLERDAEHLRQVCCRWFFGGTSRFPQSPSTGLLSRTGGYAARLV